MSFAPGTRLGAYEILSALGAGGMGEVYEARDAKLERTVALKVLPAAALSDAGARSRLLREARLAASLNHPAVCTVHDVGESDGVVYVAMELVGGRPIAEVIPAGGLPPELSLTYATQIADALAHAHERGIVHRDLKAANVLLSTDGRVKVLDFGLATRQTIEIDAATRSVASVDAPGVVAGTLPYMAPEALRGAPADPRADVWSFGVLAYEMASGRRPFHGTTGADVTSSILRDPVPPLPGRVPRGLAAVIATCLEKEPVRRYANGAELRAALVAVQAGLPRSRESRYSRSAIAAWLVGAIAAIVALLIVAAIPWRHGAPATPATRGVRSLAVLPLALLSPDAAQDYFADGLTEELINRLSRISGLTVTSRAAVMPFKGSGQPAAEIAKQLGVQALVEGTIARAADRVRITARLVDAATGTSTWSESYDRTANDVFAIQTDVASAIGEAIGSTIAPEERQRLSSQPAVSSQAYDLYLHGRFHAGRENPEDIGKAIDFLERAVAADPRFAPAHAELGRAYGQRLFYVTPGDQSLQERAFVEIERALAIDPALDTAHLARGLLLWQPWNHFPHDQAIAAYRRAIALNPNADEAHHQLGLVYLHIGLLDEAMREVREALRLNPANSLASFRVGVGYLYQGRYAEAFDVFDRTPTFFQPPLKAFQSADALFHLGRKKEAGVVASTFLSANPNDLGGMSTATEAMLAADAGDTTHMRALVARAEEKGRGYGHFHHTAFTIARAYALAGQAGDAVHWLQQAADDGYPCYPVFASDSALDRIRGDRTFLEFLTAQRAVWEGFKSQVTSLK